MVNKNEHLRIRISEDDKKSLEKKADKAGLDISSFIRLNCTDNSILERLDHLIETVQESIRLINCMIKEDDQLMNLINPSNFKNKNDGD